MPAELDACVDEVMAKGKDESSAYAICNESLYGKVMDRKLRADMARVAEKHSLRKLTAMTWDECIDKVSASADDPNAVCGALRAEGKISKVQSQVQPQASQFLDPSSGKFYIRAFLLDPTINLNQWAVTRESIDRNINTFIGKPLVFTENFDHPIPDNVDTLDHWLAWQETYRVGNIVDIVKKLNPKTGAYAYHAIIEVTNKDLVDGIRSNRVPLYVSPGLAQKVTAGVGQEEDDRAMSNWSGVHLAIVDEPAYGIKKATISDTCGGESNQCLLMLRKAHVERYGIGKCGFCIKKAIASLQTPLTSQDKNTPSKKSVRRTLSEEISKIQNVSDSSVEKPAATTAADTKPPMPTKQDQRLQSYQGDNELLAENQRLKQEVELQRMKIEELTTAKDTNTERIAALELQQRRKDVEHIITPEIIKDDKERLENVEWYTASSIPIDQIARHFNQMKMVIRKASKDIRPGSRVPYLSASSMGTGGGMVAHTAGTTNKQEEDEEGLTQLERELQILEGGF